MKELTIDAAIENIATVTAFIDEQLEQWDCPMKTKMQVHIAIDELFGNIAYYAYNPEIGIVTVRVEVTDNPLAVVITFIDNGIPYDPLAKDNPDITLSVEERDVGGLGIYMVKKTMDDISYEYKDGQDILRIKKKFQELSVNGFQISYIFRLLLPKQIAVVRQTQTKVIVIISVSEIIAE